MQRILKEVTRLKKIQAVPLAWWGQPRPRFGGGGNRAHAHLLPHGSTSEQAPRFGACLFRERHSASPRFHGKREHHPGLFTIHAIQRSTCVVQRCVYVSACTRFCSNASWARTCPTCSRSISKRTIFTSSSFACGRRQRTEKTQKKRKKKKTLLRTLSLAIFISTMAVVWFAAACSLRLFAVTSIRHENCLSCSFQALRFRMASCNCSQK